MLIMLLGCGQTGPLYLPDGPAPIHVAKPDKAESKAPTTNSSTKPEQVK